MIEAAQEYSRAPSQSFLPVAGPIFWLPSIVQQSLYELSRGSDRANSVTVSMSKTKPRSQLGKAFI